MDIPPVSASLRLSSVEPSSPSDRRMIPKPYSVPVPSTNSSGGTPMGGLTSPVLTTLSPACSPGRSHVHGEYEARLWSPGSLPSTPGTNSVQLGPSSMASVGIGFRDTFTQKTPPRSVYSDRYIPSRVSSHFDFTAPLTDTTNSGTKKTPTLSSAATESNEDSKKLLSFLLRSELLNSGGMTSDGSNTVTELLSGGGSGGFMEDDDEPNDTFATENSTVTAGSDTPSSNLLKFQSPPRSVLHPTDIMSRFSLSPLGPVTESLMAGPRKPKRRIAKAPYKVLDAPSLTDDFYLSLVDWSSQNVLAVGLGSSVYLWSAHNSKVTRLVDVGQDDNIASVAWTARGTHLSIGTGSGNVELWDVTKCASVRSFSGHTARVGVQSWAGNTLATGGRDRSIFVRDIRSQSPYTTKLEGHKQEVCGLKWSPDTNLLASGGNDNKLLVWNAAASTSPILKYSEHNAAVKALAWSPHQHGLLASGGGTADRCIRFWNTVSGAPLHYVDTGSQVCNIMWSKSVNEIVSTHGYSLNQIIVWKYPTMTKLATLTGHTYRVLYLAMSPDGQTIVTGAGDETLRFWNIFPSQSSKTTTTTSTSLLFPTGSDIR